MRTMGSMSQADFWDMEQRWEDGRLNAYLRESEGDWDEEWDESFADEEPPARLECKHFEGPDCQDC